ncbi:hypothetical protein F0562_023433 [Nyssa sinensis]|uniref:Uncharacterized protein n=1 Tax=Nyssa sinensis TaxID=561372 RepID=A0A5J5BMT8_9ASTE|nr:hypothetical protein F0562_023433 [Nyssa sinensis]
MAMAKLVCVKLLPLLAISMLATTVIAKEAQYHLDSGRQGQGNLNSYTAIMSSTSARSVIGSVVVVVVVVKPSVLGFVVH